MRIIIFFLLFISSSYGFIYEFKAKNAYNKEINFADFEDKALVVFVSNKEIKTNNELKKLNNLYNKYKTDDISFIGFAIKDSNKKNNDFCVLNYGVDFEMFGVINNELSRLEKYILHIYDNKNPILYAPILIYDRKILRFSNTYELNDKLMKIFGDR